MGFVDPDGAGWEFSYTFITMGERFLIIGCLIFIAIFAVLMAIEFYGKGLVIG